MKENRIEFLKECIKRMSDGTMLAIINEYCDSTGNRNIYLNDEDGIDSLCTGLSYDEVFRAISYGNYSYRDTYVWFNAYGNISSGDIDDTDVSFYEIAEWMIDNCYGEASHAWIIFNASSEVETGDIYYDLVDELEYRFTNTEEYLEEWVNETSADSFSSWVCQSWEDLEEEYEDWLEEKKADWDKTLERCGLV